MPVPVPDGLEAVSFADDPSLEAGAYEVVKASWPEFMLHAQVAAQCWDAMVERFPAQQVVLRRRGDGRVVGYANTIPVPWDGTAGGLPDDGWEWAISEGVRAGEHGTAPGALCALQAVVHPDLRGRGLSAVLLARMHGIARDLGLAHLLAPVRPTQKAGEPAAPMDEYVARARPDGAPEDRWLRTHWRLGARIVRVAPRSFVVRAPLEDWRRWTGLALDRDGEHLVPGAIVPVRVDTDRGVAVYVEPNVWMHHPVGGGG